MDTQKAYETIREWFSVPGREPGYDTSEDRCAYFAGVGINGLERKCAVGCLIPTSKYEPAMEDFGGFSSIDDQIAIPNNKERWVALFPHTANIVAGIDEEFIIMAQRLHDSLANDDRFTTETFVNDLDKLAATFDLNVVTT